MGTLFVPRRMPGRLRVIGYRRKSRENFVFASIFVFIVLDCVDVVEDLRPPVLRRIRISAEAMGSVEVSTSRLGEGLVPGRRTRLFAVHVKDYESLPARLGVFPVSR
jgi:hypothetical protein